MTNNSLDSLIQKLERLSRGGMPKGGMPEEKSDLEAKLMALVTEDEDEEDENEPLEVLLGKLIKGPVWEAEPETLKEEHVRPCPSKYVVSEATPSVVKVPRTVVTPGPIVQGERSCGVPNARLDWWTGSPTAWAEMTSYLAPVARQVIYTIEHVYHPLWDDGIDIQLKREQFEEVFGLVFTIVRRRVADRLAAKDASVLSDRPMPHDMLKSKRSKAFRKGNVEQGPIYESGPIWDRIWEALYMAWEIFRSNLRSSRPPIERAKMAAKIAAKRVAYHNRRFVSSSDRRSFKDVHPGALSMTELALRAELYHISLTKALGYLPDYLQENFDDEHKRGETIDLLLLLAYLPPELKEVAEVAVCGMPDVTCYCLRCTWTRHLQGERQSAPDRCPKCGGLVGTSKANVPASRRYIARQIDVSSSTVQKRLVKIREALLSRKYGDLLDTQIKVFTKHLDLPKPEGDFESIKRQANDKPTGGSFLADRKVYPRESLDSARKYGERIELALLRETPKPVYPPSSGVVRHTVKSKRSWEQIVYEALAEAYSLPPLDFSLRLPSHGIARDWHVRLVDSPRMPRSN